MYTSYKSKATLAVRAIQILCLASIVTGSLWASSDLLMVSILIDAPVTPLSVLMILYGTVGSGLCEALARWLGKNRDEAFLQTPEKKERNG